MTRTRRDLIGLHLDRSGCYCELREGTLIIRPHPETVAKKKEPDPE